MRCDRKTVYKNSAKVVIKSPQNRLQKLRKTINNTISYSFTMQDNIPEEVGNRYRQRVIDKRISDLLGMFGGLYIAGPKWCGKSWTGMHHSNSVLFVGDKDAAALAEVDPKLALAGERPRLIDEWQDVPKLWDVARRTIDLSSEKGMFIFTGSVTPPKKATLHTGTGRFARIRMRPMSLFESGDSSGAVSLSDLFSGKKITNTRSQMDYREAVRLMCRGGWPAALGKDGNAAMEIPVMYMASVTNSDFSEVDGRKRSMTKMKLLLRSIARNSAGLPTARTMIGDITEEGMPPSESALRNYMEVIKKVFLIEEQEAWMPSLRSKTRLRTSPKIHFADPSLAAAVLKASPEVLIRNVRTAGQFFESLCYRDMSIYASALGGNVYHYRDESGLEIDEIIELDDGRWGAAEVKLGTSEIDEAAKNLLSLRDAVSKDMPEPSFLAVLSATSGMAYVRDDGVCVIPMDLLGP